MNEKRIWYCKIGETDLGNLPMGADLPMRHAVAEAYHCITGEWPEFIFSGWGGELTESERAVVNDVWLPSAPATPAVTPGEPQ